MIHLFAIYSLNETDYSIQSFKEKTIACELLFNETDYSLTIIP